MSYRNPRFSYKHMLREYGALGISSGETDAVASGSTASLYDDRSKNLVLWNAAGAKDIAIYKNAAATSGNVRLGGGRLSRIMIPKGHTLEGARAIRFEASHDLLLSGAATFELADGVTYPRMAAGSGLIDIEMHPTNDDKQIASLLQMRLLVGLVGGDDHGLGELWWTETVQPTTGIATRWQDTTDAIFDRIEARSGESYKQKRGDSKRRFTHEHLHLSAADLKLYDDFYIGIGFGLHPFWYEHPDSGGAEITLEDWSDTSGTFTTTGTSQINPSAARADGEAGNIIVHEAGSFALAEWKYPIADTDAPLADWNNKILRVQVRPDWNTSATTDIKFFVESAVGSNIARTLWDVGGAFNQANSDLWYRLEIDLDAQSSSFTGSGPADLSSLTHFGFEVNRTITADDTRYGDFILIDKDKQPKLMEIVDYRRFQDSPAPSLGPTFRIQLAMLEVTT